MPCAFLEGSYKAILNFFLGNLFKELWDLLKALLSLLRPYFPYEGLIFLRKRWRLMVKFCFFSLIL